MTASKAVWFDQVRALSERREAALEMYRPLLGLEPFWGAKDSLERKLARISAEDALVWGMYDDLEVLVRKTVGPPRTVYHYADRPCGHAFLRGFEPLLEGQAHAKHLTRCPNCPWPAAQDLQMSA